MSYYRSLLACTSLRSISSGESSSAVCPFPQASKEACFLCHLNYSDCRILLLKSIKSYLVGIGDVQVCLGMLFFPFNLMYRSSRLFFLGCFRRLASSPFVKVDARILIISLKSICDFLSRIWCMVKVEL